MATKFGLAQPVRRVEDPRLLKGDGRYTDDISLPGMLWGAVLRSPHAAAKLGAIDTAAALAVPGVVAVYTGADLQADGIGGLPCAIPLKNRDGSPRSTRRTRCWRGRGAPCRRPGGLRRRRDAEGRARRRRGGRGRLRRAAVRDRPGAPTDAGQPAVWPDAHNNTCFDWETGDKERVEELFLPAAHVTRLTVVNNRVVVNSMEARAALADYDRTAAGPCTPTRRAAGSSSRCSARPCSTCRRSSSASSRPTWAAASA